MAEERQYIPISQLSDAKSVDQNRDVLIISQKQDFGDQEYVSKKITAADFMHNVDMPPAEKTKIGGFKIYDRIEDQEGEQKFVDLNEHNQAHGKQHEGNLENLKERKGSEDDGGSQRLTHGRGVHGEDDERNDVWNNLEDNTEAAVHQPDHVRELLQLPLTRFTDLF